MSARDAVMTLARALPGWRDQDAPDAAQARAYLWSEAIDALDVGDHDAAVTLLRRAPHAGDDPAPEHEAIRAIAMERPL